MSLTPISHQTTMTEDFTAISRRTLHDYDRVAERFFEGTADHDVSQNVAALLDAIGAVDTPAPFTLLDLGCGPGRDLKTFRALGHVAIGLDGSEKFVEMARAHSGCEVWHQNFMDLRLPDGFFDGIYANASLFHVPRSLLPEVLGKLFDALKPDGVLFSSNPRGDNREAYLVGAGFEPVRHYYRPPGLPRDLQPWLASVWRKPRPT